MNQRVHETSVCVPILPRVFFPYSVKVIATDTCYPIDFEASGLLFETGEVLIEYPFKDSNGKGPVPNDDGTAIHMHTLVLPNGDELDKEHWQEVASAPTLDRRQMASLAMLSESSFAYGERDGVNLFEQTVQARANVHKLVGLPCDFLLAQLGINEPPKKLFFGDEMCALADDAGCSR